MRIAHIGSVFHEVSFESESQEGREIAVLAAGLVRAGHDVTVFASGDSRTVAALVPMSQRALRHHPAPKRNLSEGLMYLALEKAFAASPAFDIIHVHAGFTAFPLMRRSPVPVLATVYGLLDTPEVAQVYRQFKELPLVATAIEQIQQCPDLNWQAIIPWHVSSHQRTRFAARVGAVEQLAGAYGAVYEQMMPAEAPRRRSSWLAHSRSGMVTPEHTVL
jgi:antitoxin (DNA-binding transcriptional repressor) of toxin-antitoxin stability system